MFVVFIRGPIQGPFCFFYLCPKLLIMDKLPWQKSIEPGMTGIQKACMIRKEQYRSNKIDMIAAGNQLASERERMMNEMRENLNKMMK